MKNFKQALIFVAILASSINFSQNNEKMIKTETEWKNTLGEMSYQVLRNSYTERPFTGEYNLHFEKGSYNCKGCNQKLFESNNKYESNCGWPSFDQAIPERIKYVRDYSHNMNRVEVKCSKCDGHLGHVFHGEKITPKDTRHCVNSLSIRFIASSSSEN